MSASQKEDGSLINEVDMLRQAMTEDGLSQMILEEMSDYDPEQCSDILLVLEDQGLVSLSGEGQFVKAEITHKGVRYLREAL